MMQRVFLKKILLVFIGVLFFLALLSNSSVVKFLEDVLNRRKQMAEKRFNSDNTGKNIITDKRYLVHTDSSEKDLKYILMWTLSTTMPFVYLKNGREAFIEEKCEYSNCYVSHDRKFLSDITKWDAVLFHGPEYTWKYSSHRFKPPEKRGPEQIYTYVSIESSHNYPSCNTKFNNFFNWTWTYKTDSDVKWGYIDIKDKAGKIIGPKEGIQWEKNMMDISESDKNELKTKTKAVAWFSSNCNSKNGREKIANELSRSLEKYGLTVDIFGRCGTFQCPRDNLEKCWAMLKDDYFFYLSFENSFGEDYVTEKFLHAIKTTTVPIVYGGADYHRFAPPGSYLNAGELGPDELARMIHILMNNIEEYSKYFRFKNYYSYLRDIESPETHAFCRMCKALNDPVKTKEHKTYGDFIGWWNGKQQQMC